MGLHLLETPELALTTIEQSSRQHLPNLTPAKAVLLCALRLAYLSVTKEVHR